MTLIKVYRLIVAEIVFLYAADFFALITELMAYCCALLWTQLQCMNSKVMDYSPCSSVSVPPELPRTLRLLLQLSNETGALKFMLSLCLSGQYLSFPASL